MRSAWTTQVQAIETDFLTDLLAKGYLAGYAVEIKQDVDTEAEDSEAGSG